MRVNIRIYYTLWGRSQIGTLSSHDYFATQRVLTLTVYFFGILKINKRTHNKKDSFRIRPIMKRISRIGGQVWLTKECTMKNVKCIQKGEKGKDQSNDLTIKLTEPKNKIVWHHRRSPLTSRVEFNLCFIQRITRESKGHFLQLSFS